MSCFYMISVITGVLKAVAKRLFKSEISFEVLDKSVVNMLDGHTQHHVTFRVDIVDDDVKSSVASAALDDNSSYHKQQPQLQPLTTLYKEGATPLISPQLFCQLFPFHIVFNSELVIQQCGMNLQKLRPMELYVGKTMSDVFTLIRPQIPFTFEHIHRFINASFVLELVESEGTPALKDNAQLTEKKTRKNTAS